MLTGNTTTRRSSTMTTKTNWNDSIASWSHVPVCKAGDTVASALPLEVGAPGRVPTRLIHRVPAHVLEDLLAQGAVRRIDMDAIAESDPALHTDLPDSRSTIAHRGDITLIPSLIKGK